jgi:hypothetical protein
MEPTEKQANCKARWAKHKTARIQDIRKLWRLYQKDPDANHPDLGNLNEYGLAFCYVPPGTFPDQLEGYWQYQLSTGGPGEEFRFYSSTPGSPCYRISFVFLDWYDGHERELVGRDRELLEELWAWFQEAGTVEHVYTETLKGI